MTEAEDLFGNIAPPPVPVPSREETLPDWRVKMLRNALDEQGLESMADRQALVERLVGRAVPSLKDLTHSEAQVITDALIQPSPIQRSSTWDDREEDTWIDRL